jgi:cephalosporin hydroxylase
MQRLILHLVATLAWIIQTARRLRLLADSAIQRRIRRARPVLEPYRSKLSMSLYKWMTYHQDLMESTKVHWLGVPAVKSPLDLWILQEIIYETKPQVIVEIGSFYGGSTIYMATVLSAISPTGRIISVDISRERYKASHPHIIEITGDSTNPDVVKQVKALCAGKRTMIVHDGAHDRLMVTRDLSLYADLVSPGCYLIVEDATVDVFRPGDKMGREWEGPLPAIRDFLAQNSDFSIDRSRERYIVTYSPQGYLKRKG